ncbi:hypothetical protein LTR78_006157 [Recurvomyces mirabilis]|uniref:Rad4-domain-containing protein n=1 Tax=Recurvomyces mirabilis TaxID=574656 RepID=A0AAE0WLL2_9PEZI|nr:hypothetical protein LTR78_006157 [Recurvomyces mirabilis]KAK5151999.1 hypothetical protein LTS14_008773 [Recurvomyces mirabilis]
MASSRGKGKTPATPTRAMPSRPSTRATRGRKTMDTTPDVYQDMLIEAAVTNPEPFDDRPLKRRRIAGPSGPFATRHKDEVKQPLNTSGNHSTSILSRKAGLQTIDASDDDDDESDFGFEDVDLGQPDGGTSSAAEDDAIGDVTISLEKNSTPKPHASKTKRKPASSVEKAHRLLVHKAHFLCLLGHCIYANSWCNDEAAQSNLKSIMSPKTKAYLRDNPDKSQFDRNRMFVEGLEQVSEAFRGAFSVTASGMRKASWVTDGSADEDRSDIEPMDRADFIRAAKRREGSQDTGAQLFCALLRSIRVVARLVCSLQTLPINPTATKTTPVRPVKRIIYASDAASADDHTASDGSTDDMGVKTSSRLSKIPSARRRLGQPGFAKAADPAITPQQKKKSVRTLAYPVFWVEVFNAAVQKWVTVDCVVTGTVNKPGKLEPPSSYDLNQLSYAIAFEEDGSARDVTRRYAKAFNAKTRRQRVEATQNGAAWMKKALRVFRRKGAALDRDQVEDAELAAKEAREGLPSNVQDFKDHPYYALERHLRRHEVIFPKREAGKVNAGTAAKPRMEAVFRRQDVHVCRSADKWFRLGREMKAGEQPLKHVVSRRVARAKSITEEEDEAAGQKTTALYAAYQTALYSPPPVIRGKVPRNGFGNLDIYVPSMVPAGGAHIRHPLTQQAAKILRVDFADAVTGFKFKGRQGTAVIEGAIVAEQFADSVRNVIESLEWEAEEEKCKQRSLVALRLWARMLKGLRIQERVKSYRRPGEGGGEADGADDAEERQEKDENDITVVIPHLEEDSPLWTAGRYSVRELVAPKQSSAKKKRKQYDSDEDVGEAGDFNAQISETANAGSTAARRATRSSRRRVVDDQDDDVEGAGGGFLPDADESDDDSGGFVPEGGGDEDDEGGGFLVGSDSEGGRLAAEDEKRPYQHEHEHQEHDHASSQDDGGGGGGFMVDAAQKDITDDSPGGGFLPEDNEIEQPDAASPRDLKLLPTTMTDTIPTKSADMKEMPSDRFGISTPETHVGENSSMDKLLEHHRALTDAQSAPEPVEGGKTDAQAMEVDGHSDEGSLLSHDPEDEDAEPDWLESD